MKKKDLLRTVSTLQDYVDRLSVENEKLKYLERVNEEREAFYQRGLEKFELLETALTGAMLDIAATMQSPAVTMNVDASKRFSEILEKMNESLEECRGKR